MTKYSRQVSSRNSWVTNSLSHATKMYVHYLLEQEFSTGGRCLNTSKNKVIHTDIGCIWYSIIYLSPYFEAPSNNVEDLWARRTYLRSQAVETINNLFFLDQRAHKKIVTDWLTMALTSFSPPILLYHVYFLQYDLTTFTLCFSLVLFLFSSFRF